MAVAGEMRDGFAGATQVVLDHVDAGEPLGARSTNTIGVRSCHGAR